MPSDEGEHLSIPVPQRDGWLYSDRFVRALTTAAQMHAAQVRKTTTIPYVSHLLGTCAIALEYGANEDEAIAALLHDAIEDVEPIDEARAAVASFGDRVLAIVEGCSDSDIQPKPPWRERKAAYIAHLADADASILLVSASDKLHNARTILADLHRVGDELWTRFKPSREESIGYYRALVDGFRAKPGAQRRARRRARPDRDGHRGVPDCIGLIATRCCRIGHGT